jgi:hypothetical protein
MKQRLLEETDSEPTSEVPPTGVTKVKLFGNTETFGKPGPTALELPPKNDSSPEVFADTFVTFALALLEGRSGEWGAEDKSY